MYLYFSFSVNEFSPVGGEQLPWKVVWGRTPVGHSHCKVVCGRAALKTPFSCHILAPETHLFKPFSSSGDPHLDFLKKILYFKTNFGWFLAPETHILAKIRYGDPSFKLKNQFQRRYFWKPLRHISIPNFLATTSPGDVARSLTTPPPFFFFFRQSALPNLPIYHQCVIHVPFISILGKIIFFSFVFGQKVSSQDASFPSFC